MARTNAQNVRRFSKPRGQSSTWGQEKQHLEQRLAEKSRAIAHLQTNIATLKQDTAKKLTEAKESDALKDELLVFGTKACTKLREQLEALQKDQVELTALLQARSKSLETLQDAFLGAAPQQVRAAINTYSEQSLALVRSLKEDVAREQAASLKLRDNRKAGWRR